MLETDDIVVGKDILELLSSSMYLDPITVYREYVQNAADAIDEARRGDLFNRVDDLGVQIEIDHQKRAIRIRDNGTGIPANLVRRKLLSFGASGKRGTKARGFRGVGRLSGLGYCQQLIFRTRSAGEQHITEMTWDCKRLRAALRDSEYRGRLSDLVSEVAQIRHLKEDGAEPRFFEVEMRGVVRHGSDRLLDEDAVGEYLSQVAPVPFSGEFRYSTTLNELLSPHVEMGNVQVRIQGREPITRPHRNFFVGDDNALDEFDSLEVIRIPSVDGGLAAVGWVLHHGYKGAIPTRSSIKGLRLRCGNIQIGDSAPVESLFSEARFNSWSVGELHIVDQKVTPNGRRDSFEQSVHLDNILNHIAPIAREIGRRCRQSSIRRRWLREIDLQATAAAEKIEILQQGAIGKRGRDEINRQIGIAIAKLEKMEKSADRDDDRERVSEVMGKLRSAGAGDRHRELPEVLARLPKTRRVVYEQVFDLIYQCSTNRSAAKSLVDRILLEMAR